MTTVPIDQLLAIAEKVREVIEHADSDEHSGDITKMTQRAPNTVLLCNIITTILHAQPGKRKLSHLIRYTREDGKIVMQLHKVRVLDAQVLDALRNLSPRILGMRYEFTSLEDGEPIWHGMLIFDVLHTAVERIPPLAAYVEPVQRRSRALDIDWSDNVVLVNDRKSVLAVIDDVYNMHQVMPGKITVSIETIDDTDYTKKSSGVPPPPTLAKRKRSVADTPEDALSETVSASAAPHLGYCLHFVGVPSFDDNFLVHMARKYATRWLGATVIFPRRIADKNILMPCQLLVSLGCEHALVQASKPRAICGAKRLCKKMLESAVCAGE